MELLAVVIILGIIGLITVPIVNQLMKVSKEKAYHSQIEMLEDTALRWGTSHNEELPKEGNVMALSFSDLQKSGTLKQETVKDPRTGKNLKGCIYVQYSEAYQQYLYQYKEECDPSMGLWKAPVITVNGKTVNQKIRLEVTDSYTIPEGTAIDYEGNPLPVTVKGNVTPDLPGTYEIVYSATDSKGITGTLILTIVVYDPSIPTIDYVIEGTQFNGFYTSNVIVTLTGLNNGEPVSKYEYRVNMGSGYKSWNKIDTNQFIIENEGNQIQFQVRSRNKNGNLSETKESANLKIDKTKPVVKSLTLNPNTWSGKPITVIVEATDNVGGIANYSFDNGATWQESNEKSFSENNTIYVLVSDKAGHISEGGANSQIVIDRFETVKPSIKIELVGTPFNENGWAKDDFKVRVEGTVGKSGIKSFQYCQTTEETCTPTEAINEINQEVTISTESSSNKVCTRLIDHANQDTGVICSDTYPLDKTRPVVNQVVLDPTTWTSSPIKVKVNATDNVSGVIEYSFDEGMTWQPTSEKSFTGNQEIKVMVKDKAGNTSISNVSSQITIDKYETIKPTIEYQVVGTPINTNGWATANFNVNVISHVGQSGMKNGTFKYCTTTGSTCTPTTVINTTSQVVAITTESASNKICAQIMDNAGQNSGVICSSLYKLDKTKPVISSITKNPSGWTTGNITITVNASDTGSSGLKEYSYDNGSTWTTSKTKTYTGNTSAFNVKVRDGAGNTSAATSVTISNKETVTPTIALAIDGTSPFNANGWSKTDIPIKITSTVGKSGVKAVKYCLSTTANCTPGTTSSSKATAQTVKITTQSATNYICAIVTDNANQTSAKKCLGPYKLDKSKPTITAKATSYTITKGDSKDPKTYFTIGTFGISGGSTTCSITNTSSLNVGTTKVTCTSTARNGNSASANTNVVVKPKELTPSDIVNNGGGIEKIGDTYYFRGSNPNNYIKFNGVTGDDSLWQIVSITNGVMKLKRVESLGSQYWHTNSNEWTQPAHLNNYLDTTYKNSLATTIRSKIKNNSFSIGKINGSSTSATPASIKSEEAATKWIGDVGLINASDYVYASKDANCAVNAINNTTCKNENWLYNSQTSSWTIDASSQNSRVVMIVNTTGELSPIAISFMTYCPYECQIGGSSFDGRPCSSYTCPPMAKPVYHKVYPVIFLNTNIKMNIGGTGTSANPYVIQ